MSKSDGPRIKFVDEEWGGLGEALRDNEENGELMSRRMQVKLLWMWLLHPFGIHYLVPAYGLAPGTDRWVELGSTCWFCQ